MKLAERSVSADNRSRGDGPREVSSGDVLADSGNLSDLIGKVAAKAAQPRFWVSGEDAPGHSINIGDEGLL